MLLASLSLLFAQAALPRTLDEDRLSECLEQARKDPATAIVTADNWLSEVATSAEGKPQQCLGQAYTMLLRWDAAQSAFTAARDAAPQSDPESRARFGAMAVAAALAGQQTQAALALADTALSDAKTAQATTLAGTLAADRARALVLLGREAEAQVALGDARRDAPQDGQIWLLSATLARRMGALDTAQSYIETASALSPNDPSVGLEAGVIAVLDGREEAARTSWQSIIFTHPATQQASAAARYIAQLDGAPPSR